MTNSQAIVQLDKSEEYFVVELKKRPTQELRRFLVGSWTASILSPEAIEELYRYQEKRQKEELSQQVH
jgi:hypothetical protein